MTSKSTTKHRDGDGRWHEATTTHYPSGASKTVTKDITERTLLHDGNLETVTHRDPKGNSRTEKF